MKKLCLSAALLGLLATAANADGPLRLGMTPEPYMPFTSVDSAGEWIGLEGDLTRALCDKIEDGCEFKQMSWDGLIPSLTENKVDFIVGAFSITDERKQTVDFSTAYFTEGTSFVGAKRDPIEVKLTETADGSGQVVSPEGLENSIIGAQTASVQANYLSTYLPDVEMKGYPTGDNSVADLVAGRVDYLLAPDMFIAGFLKDEAGAEFEVKLTVPGNPVLGEGVAYATRKDDSVTLEKVNAALAELEADGTLQKLIDQWIFEK